jgi:RNase P subunit RPR2
MKLEIVGDLDKLEVRELDDLSKIRYIRWCNRLYWHMWGLVMLKLTTCDSCLTALWKFRRCKVRFATTLSWQSCEVRVLTRIDIGCNPPRHVADRSAELSEESLRS